MDLTHGMTLVANQKLPVMLFVGMEAADKGAEGFQTVDEVVFEQEVQCPVDCWRRGIGLVGLQLVQQVMGLDRPGGFDNQFKDPATVGRQTPPAPGARLVNVVNNKTQSHES